MVLGDTGFEAITNNDSALVADSIESPALRVGALLYTPATTQGIASKLAHKWYPNLTSIALCLEDSIPDHMVLKAESNLFITLSEIRMFIEKGIVAMDDLPMIFIRIRNPQHMLTIFERLQDNASLISGFIAPKFDSRNVDEYFSTLRRINTTSSSRIYIMPILESPEIVSIDTRIASMVMLKKNSRRIGTMSSIYEWEEMISAITLDSGEMLLRQYTK